MKLENQVCTLGQSLRLAELGIIQDGYFSWYSFNGNRKPQEHIPYISVSEQLPEGYRKTSAFTAAELLRLMPPLIPANGRWGGKSQTFGMWQRNDPTFFVYYSPSEIGYTENEYLGRFINENLAEAVTEMAISLIEFKHVTVEWMNDVISERIKAWDYNLSKNYFYEKENK